MSDNISLQLRGDITDLQRALLQGGRLVQDFGRGAQRDLEGTGRAAERAGKQFLSLADVLSVFGMREAGRFGWKAMTGELTQFESAMVSAQTTAQKLQNTLSFAIGKDSVAKEMVFLRETTKSLGLEFTSTAAQYGRLAAAARGTSMEGQRTREVFTAIAEASAVMGMNVEETEGAFRAVQQMMSKGKVMAEELRGQLGERLPGAFQIAARAMGVTTGQLDKMLERGEVFADEFLPRFAAQLKQELGGSVADAANSAQAATNRYTNAYTELKQALADAGFADFAIQRQKALADSFYQTAAAMREAKAEGDGLLMTLLKGFGTDIGLRNPLTGISMSARDNQYELAEARKRLQELQAQSEVMGNSIYWKAEKAEVTAYIARLEEALGLKRQLTGDQAGAIASGESIRSQYPTRGQSYENEERRLAGNRARLDSLTQRLSGQSESYQKTLQELYSLYVNGTIKTVEEYRRYVTQLIEKEGGIKKGERKSNPADSVFRSISERTAELRAEISQQENLTSAQKLASKVLDDMRTGTLKLSEVEKMRMGIALQLLLTEDKANTEREAAAKLEEDRIRTVEKATELSRKMHAQRDRELEREIQTNEKLREEISLIGLDDEARTRRLQVMEQEAIARLELDLIQAKNIEGNEVEIAQLEREIAIRRDRVGLMGEKAAREGAAKVQEEWKKTTEQINDDLTDALLRGFEDGKGFADNFRDTLENMFKTLVLRPIISATLSPISNAISSLVGGITGQGGGGGGLMGLASNAYSMYTGGSSLMTVGSQWLGGTMSTANAAGTLFANATGGGLDALLATNGAYGTAGGAGGAGAGGLGAMAGPFIAILAPLFAAWADGMFDGESRASTEVRYDASKGFSTGWTNEADDQVQMATQGLLGGVIAGLNETFSVLGLDLSVASAQGQWEESDKSRGGVYSGLTLSDGTRVGESGDGSNYGAWDPMRSKYEWWTGGIPLPPAGSVDGSRSAEEMQQAMALFADPEAMFERFQLDTKQLALETLQVVAGMRFGMEKKTWETEYMGFDGNGGEGGSYTTLTAQNALWVRTIDETALAMADAAKVLPDKIWQLIRGKDFESMGEEEVNSILTQINAMVANVKGFREIVAMMPVAEFKTASFDIADSLVKLFGSVEAFGTSLAAYVEHFYSPEEKRAQTIANIAQALSAAGLAVTEAQLLAMANSEDARLQFRAWVESQDMTTEAGLKAKAALIGVAGAFASVTQEAKAVVDSAYETFQRALAREMEAAQAAREVAQEQVDLLSDLFNYLKDEVQSLYGEVRSTAAMQAAQGFKFITDALSTAQATGYLPDLEALSDAVSAVRGTLDDPAKSAWERERDRLVLAGKLAALGELTGEQLTVAERELQAAERQVELLEAMEEEARLLVEGQTAGFISVVDALAALRAAILGEPAPGTPAPGGAGGAGGEGAFAYADPNRPGRMLVPGAGGVSVLPDQIVTDGRGTHLLGTSPSLAKPALEGDRAREFNLDFFAGAGFGEWLAGPTYTGDMVVPSWYRNHPDVPPMSVEQEAAGARHWIGLIAEGMGVDQVKQLFSESVATVTGKPVVPISAFAAGGDFGGGMARVGEFGEELAYMPPARIYSAPDTRQMLIGADEVVGQLRTMNALMADLIATAGEGAGQSARVADVLTGSSGVVVPIPVKVV